MLTGELSCLMIGLVLFFFIHFCLPSQYVSTLKGKNLHHTEGKLEVTKVVPLGKNGIKT